MEKISKSILSAVAILFVLLSGCSDHGKLTDQKAENAIRQWPAQTNKPGVKVLGIQEFPQTNTAVASVTLSHFVYNQPQFLGPRRPLDYSGPAEATFTHYNDGRWVLTNVEVPDRNFMLGKATFEMNVEAR